MPINDSFMLPKRVRTMEQMEDLLQAEQSELTQMHRVIANLENQINISTSTFLLSRHEQIFDIPFSPAATLEIRRATLLSKLNTSNVTSCRFIKTLAESFIDGTAEVKEYYTDYRFCIVVNVTMPPEMDVISALLQQIEVVKPAHLIADLVILINKQLKHYLYTGFAVRVGRVIAVGCEIPAALDVTYLTDETGSLLADEAGNRIIDEEE